MGDLLRLVGARVPSGVLRARRVPLIALVAVGLLASLPFGAGATGGGRRDALRHGGVCTNASVISSWSVARRAAQLVAVPVEETSVTTVEDAVHLGVGGIVLFGSAAPANLGAQLRGLDDLAPDGIAPFVMADEEGGGVQRMANLVGSMPWPREMAASMTPSEVESLVTGVARKMRAAGVGMDLAPVLDLASGPGPDAQHTDGPRSFSPDAPVATSYGLAFVRGLEAGGVVPVVKHFPGEGSASANTDLAPASTPPLHALEKADLLPFEAAIRSGVPAVMVGNATVPGLSRGVPASLSSRVIGTLLRGELGFRGLILTDSLSAVAISARGLSVRRAALDAVRAGADLVLFNSSTPNATAARVISSLVGAVAAHTLSTATLDGAVAEVLLAKHVALCR